MQRSSPRSWCARVATVLVALGAAGAVRPAGAAEPPASPATLVAGWRALAEASTSEAFRQLTVAYRAQKDETLRGLLVTTVCEAVRTDAGHERLQAWRLSSTSPADAWLWYRALLKEGERAPTAPREALDADAPPELRAAAVRAAAAWADPEALPLVGAAVRRQWGEGKAGALLVEAWADVVARQPARAGTPPFREAVLALAEYVETQAPEPRTRLAVGRSLAAAFETDDATTDPRMWRSLAERAEPPPEHVHDGHTAGATASFFDLDATGDRVLYLLDASSSMDDPLEPGMLEALQKLGARQRPGGAAAIDWSRVRTARQAVTEVTKVSLRSLPPTLSFCVVLFGSDAKPLPSTPGLVPATPQNVAAACRDLDAARRSPSRGTTNFHGGLRRAFDVTAVGRDGRPLFAADPVASLGAGATTMFLLTDGVPSRDDWDDTANLVTGRPWFADTPAILEDVARMNLLRACELHAVALGHEARKVLEPLARLGGGHVRVVAAGAPPLPAVEEVAALPRGPFRRAVDDLLPRLSNAGAEAARDDLRGLVPKATSAVERVWVAHRLARLGDRREVPTLLDALRSPSDDVARLAEAGLAALAHRSFGAAPGRTSAERTALHRNWAWWWERHAGADAGPR